jgi:hypothetical protein
VTQLLAVEKRKDRDNAATFDVERGPIERNERLDHLIDLLRQEPKERVLPPHALEIRVLDPHDELTRLEDRAACAAEDPLPLWRKSQPVAIDDGFPDGPEFRLWAAHVPRLAEIDYYP